MSEEKLKPQPEAKKGFWGKLIDKLDKKMQQKCDSQSCCGSKQHEKKCCS